LTLIDRLKHLPARGRLFLALAGATLLLFIGVAVLKSTSAPSVAPPGLTHETENSESNAKKTAAQGQAAAQPNVQPSTQPAVQPSIEPSVEPSALSDAQTATPAAPAKNDNPSVGSKRKTTEPPPKTAESIAAEFLERGRLRTALQHYRGLKSTQGTNPAFATMVLLIERKLKQLCKNQDNQGTFNRDQECAE